MDEAGGHLTVPRRRQLQVLAWTFDLGAVSGLDWQPLREAVAGCTACAYTGVAYAEYANLGAARRTEATGLGTAVMFAAVMVVPPLFGV